MKKCTRCLKLQPLDQYPTHKNYKDGLSSWCRVCLKKNTADWAKRNPEKAKAGELRRESRCLINQTRRKWKLKARYNLTIEQYDAMVLAQDNKCAICNTDGKHGTKGKLFVDHNHHTGKVRALLCDSCNKVLGCAFERIERLESAIKYLKLHND